MESNKFGGEWLFPLLQVPIDEWITIILAIICSVYYGPVITNCVIFYCFSIAFIVVLKVNFVSVSKMIKIKM